MTSAVVRPLDDGDRPWVRDRIATRWSLPVVSVSGHHDPTSYPGFAAVEGDTVVGLATYLVDGDSCELLTIDSDRQGGGVGTLLLEAVRSAASAAGCRKLWLVTTNDNLRALRFYQRRGLDMVAVHRDFMDLVRRAKPSLPDHGHDGIPLRHAIELEALF